ncbi:MAG TPA: GPGG-motif small membrane protein [Acidimicrobiales bacterium]|nr:GPGG-motif small membrane protein [Acidimicrobiales bacterium]
MLALIIAVVLFVVGIVQLLQGQVLLGALLLVLAAVVGPGGYSLSRRRL